MLRGGCNSLPCNVNAFEVDLDTETEQKYLLLQCAARSNGLPQTLAQLTEHSWATLGQHLCSHAAQTSTQSCRCGLCGAAQAHPLLCVHRPLPPFPPPYPSLCWAACHDGSAYHAKAALSAQLLSSLLQAWHHQDVLLPWSSCCACCKAAGSSCS